MASLRAYAQLLRIPNVFTALADVLMGWMVITTIRLREVEWMWPGGVFDFEPEEQSDIFLGFLGLLTISAALYCAGMVLNDLFDEEEDRRERPHRPIPSGRVSSRNAGFLCCGLLALGTVIGTLVGPPGLDQQPSLIALALAGCIVLYDAWLKRTWAGPIGMGGCRFLNVTLGLAAWGHWPQLWMLHLAAVVGIYIVGVTWFARTEATASSRRMLLAAASVMLGAVALAAGLPAWSNLGHPETQYWYPPLLLAWAVVVGRPVVMAIRHPDAAHVQAAVKRCILGLIGLDAVLAFPFIGWSAFVILLLLIPALVLGRWVYST